MENVYTVMDLQWIVHTAQYIAHLNCVHLLTHQLIMVLVLQSQSLSRVIRPYSANLLRYQMLFAVQISVLSQLGLTVQAIFNAKLDFAIAEAVQSRV
jgi:hypothetical protein